MELTPSGPLRLLRRRRYPRCMAPAPTIWTFLRTFREHLFALMSGGLSVPFAAAAAYYDSLPAKVGFTLLAITALTVAAYSVWRTEREALIKAEAKIDRRAIALRLLGEIGTLRTQLVALRIEMERPEATQKSFDHWHDERFMPLDEEIGNKIAELAGPGEAELHRNRGNMTRRFGEWCPPHQLVIDLCIFDLDRLAAFIRHYSSKFST